MRLYQVMMKLYFCNDAANDAESTKNFENYLIIATGSLKSETIGKLINASFDIKFTWLSFEKACWIDRQASRCQQAFSKPFLLNFISKDTNLVFCIQVAGDEI